jgi:hypothetical protein
VSRGKHTGMNVAWGILSEGLLSKRLESLVHALVLLRGRFSEILLRPDRKGNLDEAPKFRQGEQDR